MDITCVINAHREGEVLRGSIYSAIRAVEEASSADIQSEIVIVLDETDSITRNVANSFVEWVQVVEVDFGELSQSRNHAVRETTGNYIAFLDGDDLWGSEWLARAFKLSESLPNSVLHPQFNVYFADSLKSGRQFIFEHLSQNSDEFDLYSLGFQNYWTALTFADRRIYESVPFVPVNKSMRTGFEDWAFNLEVISDGFNHMTVPDTYHFIRQKSSDSMKKAQSRIHSVPIITDIWSSAC